jgi:hypothetical protein
MEHLVNYPPAFHQPTRLITRERSDSSIIRYCWGMVVFAPSTRSPRDHDRTSQDIVYTKISQVHSACRSSYKIRHIARPEWVHSL